MDFFREYVQDWEQWIKVPNILTARYEDLLQNYEAETTKLVRFLGVQTDDEKIKQVIEKYRPSGEVQGQQGTHFFKGQIGRFRERYTEEEQKILAENFGDSLKKMGYEI